MDNIPSNYLNNAQINQAIEAQYLAQDTKTLALAGLELTVERFGILHFSAKPRALYNWRNI